MNTILLLTMFAFPNFTITDDGVLQADNITQEIVSPDMQIYTAGEQKWAVTTWGVFKIYDGVKDIKIKEL